MCVDYARPYEFNVRIELLHEHRYNDCEVKNIYFQINKRVAFNFITDLKHFIYVTEDRPLPVSHAHVAFGRIIIDL